MWRDGIRLLFVRPLVERPSRTLLTLLGVACGVALYVAVVLLRTATIDHFAKSVSSLAGGASLTVEGDESGFDESLLETVERVPGVDRVAPMVHARARIEGGTERGVVVLGVDMLREPAVRAHAIEGDVDDPLELLADSDAVLIPQSLAFERKLARGSRITLATASGPKELLVRGIVADDGAARTFGGRVVFMDIDAARVTFGKEGRTDRLDVLAKKGTDDARLAADITAALGSGAWSVERPSDQSAAFRAMIASYDRVLAELARLALVVAVLLVGGSLRFTVAERRAEIGVLRAIGASRRLVVGAFLAQAAFLGLLGGALGLAGGRALAGALVFEVAKGAGLLAGAPALDDAGPVGAAALNIDRGVVLAALASGLIAALCGALVPALRAASVAPKEALAPKGVSLDASTRFASIAGIAAGVLLLASACVPALAYDVLPVWARDTTLTCAFVGAALIAPRIAALAARVAMRAVLVSPLGRVGAVRVAAGSLTSSGRSEGAAAIAVSLVVTLLICAAHLSLRDALGDATSRMLASDVWVAESAAFLTGRSEPLPSEVAREIDQVPGVAAGTRGLRISHVRVSGRSVLLKAWDRPPAGRSPIVVREGDDQAMFDAPAVLVSETFAQHFQKRVGETIDLDTPSGRTSFRIAAIVVDFSSPQGTVHIHRARFAELWHDDRVTAFFADAAPGLTAVELRERIDGALGRRRGVVVRDTAELRAASVRSLDDAFSYAKAMQSASLFVSLIALVTGVFASMLERRRELGTLRAVGMSGRALASMIVVEASALGLGSAAAALVLGAYLSHVWLGVTLAREIGWPVAVHMPAAAAATALAAGVIVGALAGLFGARQAARIEPARALAEG
jgi:putative ABC transport system permease protein